MNPRPWPHKSFCIKTVGGRDPVLQTAIESGAKPKVGMLSFKSRFSTDNRVSAGSEKVGIIGFAERGALQSDEIQTRSIVKNLIVETVFV